MRWFLYLVILVSLVSVPLSIFPKAFVYAEGSTLEVVGEIPAPTAELKVVDMVKPSDLGFEVIEKVPAPSPTFTITPIEENPPLTLTPIKYVPAEVLPTISNPIPLSPYPVLIDPIPIDPKPILTNPVPIKLRPVLSNPIPIELPLPPSENPKFSKPIEELIALAKTDLSQRLGIKIEEISVQSIVEKTWPDASLGCPKEGRLYAQVITPGYLIILRARGEVYDYRASLNWVTFCSSLEEAEHSGEDSLGNLQTETFISNSNTREFGQAQTLPNNLPTIIGRLKIVLAKFFLFNPQLSP